MKIKSFPFRFRLIGYGGSGLGSMKKNEKINKIISMNHNRLN